MILILTVVFKSVFRCQASDIDLLTKYFPILKPSVGASSLGIIGSELALSPGIIASEIAVK